MKDIVDDEMVQLIYYMVVVSYISEIMTSSIFLVNNPWGLLLSLYLVQSFLNFLMLPDHEQY